MSRPGRPWLALVGGGLGIALFVAGGIGLAADTPDVSELSAAEPGAGRIARDASLDTIISNLQTRLESVPNDDVSWASLGLAYVQQARVTAVPNYYGLAEGALERSLELDADDNFLAAAGMSNLASARHDFQEARRWAEVGLRINPSSPTLYGALDDALTQLGDYEGAREATQRMVDLAPSTASLARVSYSWELRGDIDQARRYMQRARDEAGSPADIAFTERYLGDLEFNGGDPRMALAHYQAGLDAFATDIYCLEGRAKANAALGNVEAAVADYSSVTERAPEPAFVLAYGEYLESLGRVDEAQDQYDLFRVVTELFVAAGVAPDVDQTLFEADHGDPAAALAAGEAGIASRGFLEMQDAYAWALHVNGRDTEALAAITAALAVGTRSALLHYHAGMIQRALGDRDAARTELTTALAINPSFSPLWAPDAEQALAELEATP